ncbi:IS1096 element passenger TnpR family protein [Caldanaerobius polysaccharolyticus]|uniref:IS1096 element passenger TnpR family protein n=1 Tax=Caldanaerobius polysaccharolyticus TaxID=44256 RepID=UPI0006920145|nr:hypothetical protein [Caldanaerobius polysaccharolyticus]
MKGKCYYCGREFERRGMLRHLSSCYERARYLKSKMENSKNKSGKEYFVLGIWEKYEPSLFWMYIAIDKETTLRKLDKFIRDVWVECCGHLSCFDIEGERYEVSQDDEWLFGEPSKSMDYKLSDVLRVGMRFTYKYDYGSTTYVDLSVVGEFKGFEVKKRVEIMARNNEPVFQCSFCEKEAKYYCYYCESYFCEDCIQEHECEEEGVREIEFANSPRVGVCGYVGSPEDEVPYLPKFIKR